MRIKIILGILVLQYCSVYCQNDFEIYSKVINDFALKLQQPSIDYSSSTTLTVLENPIYMDSLEMKDFVRFQAKYADLDQKTFSDFIEKNQSSSQIAQFDFPGIEMVMLNSESPTNRRELQSKYPKWIPSILEVSNIGFNEPKTQALVYYGFDSGPGVGGGIYIVFEKKRRKWKQQILIPAWAT